MTYHRYISLDVGFSLVPGNGRMGGETEHAPYAEAKKLADAVDAILRKSMREGSLKGYVLERVVPTKAHGEPKTSR
jgi:hypothetical protein